MSGERPDDAGGTAPDRASTPGAAEGPREDRSAAPVPDPAPGGAAREGTAAVPGDPHVVRGPGGPGRFAALARKYRVLASLAAEREARVEGGRGSFPPAEAAARRAAMRRVARRFPGALRELDRLPAATLAARADLAAAVAARLAEEPAAAIPVGLALAAAYHAELRRALARKRWLATRPEVRRGRGEGRAPASPVVGAALPDDLVAAFAGRFRLPPPDAARAIAGLLRPPGGRLGAAVLADVAARFGLAAAEAHELLFGPRSDG